MLLYASKAFFKRHQENDSAVKKMTLTVRSFFFPLQLYFLYTVYNTVMCYFELVKEMIESGMDM